MGDLRRYAYIYEFVNIHSARPTITLAKRSLKIATLSSMQLSATHPPPTQQIYKQTNKQMQMMERFHIPRRIDLNW